MTEKLVGTGREADIIALDGGRVLRQYREARDVEAEARAMAHALAHGIPVPRVFETRENAIVMERIEGPTMLAYMASHPWQLWRQGRLLASLHEQLHAVPALTGLPQPFAASGSLLHWDLHPDNVLLSPNGLVVIDWSAARNGPAGADVARTWMLIDSSEIPGGAAQRLIATAGRGLFLRAFLNRAGRGEARHFLREVGAERLQDTHLVGNEAQAIRALVAREATA